MTPTLTALVEALRQWCARFAGIAKDQSHD